MNAADIIACSRCHCRHHAEDFGVNRLGERWKTCVSCRNRPQRGRVLDLGYVRMIRRGVVGCSESSASQRVRRNTDGIVSPSVGIPLDHYADFIENQFEPGMTWFNHGTANIYTRERWQIDHIKPIGSGSIGGGIPSPCPLHQHTPHMAR